MIDLIDLLYERYEVYLDHLDERNHVISFLNQAGDHECEMNIHAEDMILLASNLERVLDKLRGIQNDK